MTSDKNELTSRYYVAEAAVWLLGAVLLVSRLLNVMPSQSVPFLNITLDDPRHFPRLVAALLIGASLYLIFEWKQSSREARVLFASRVRNIVAALFACGSLWISYPIIAEDTGFADVSPAWFFGFLAIGFLLAWPVSILVFSSLMIRTAAEAKRLHLPRIPVATKAQYANWIPVVCLLLAIFYVLHLWSPKPVAGLSPLLTGIPFILLLAEKLTTLFFWDERGNRISYAKRIAQFKKIHDSHDYSYLLIERGERLRQKGGVPTTSPQEIQRSIREKFAADNPLNRDQLQFRVEIGEEVTLEPCPKDGNPENVTPANRAVRVHTRDDKKALQCMIFEDPQNRSMELEVPTSLIEQHAEQYGAAHADTEDLSIDKVVSYAVNEAVKTLLLHRSAPLLGATMQGKEEEVAKLLKQDVDVNERVGVGWTALLAATAQGYSNIMKRLLDAGANPDIGNLHSITPLMYTARYGNLESCKLLLDYGANLNLQDWYGETALMVAVRTEHIEVAAMLIEAGADVTIKDMMSRSALDIAHSCKQGQIAKLIRAASKNRQQPTK